ncbi:protein translocase subunit SecF [Vulgatibacter incomptus]|uniref:Protein-export membrane protein SecF n=1 Tax=Vulgatibacter incomptus TaxID=1391653 RepID=A0A0K1P8Z7_9BACT|nr:protein translocase subunit SecF [Vulgatibacter incomptus]AKU89886.1 Protein-export membrane protein SecF [Vulgatibacter incomptus]
MELIKPGTNFDFLGKRRLLITISLALIAGVLVLLPFRINFGVDFAGGTEIEVKFNQPVSAKDVRLKIEEAGFHDASVQQFGTAEENSFLVRVQRVSILSHEQAEALRQNLEKELAAYGVESVDFDEHVGDRVDIRTERPVPLEALRGAATGTGVHLSQTSEPIRDLTRAGQPAYQVLTQGLSDKVSEALRASFGEDTVDVRRVEYVGPQVGQQLRNRGIMAVLLSMVAILLYIAFRFDLRFAPGAVVGLFHDVAVVLGYWVVTGREFNLTSIAVILTVVGYSVNDTIVVFDRVREVLARNNGKSLLENINIATNEALGRTVITSGVTALSLVGLLIFTSGSLFDFAAAMLVGIIAGTYSSVFISGPVAVWIDHWMQKRDAQKAALAGTTRGATKRAPAHAD